MKNLTVGKRIVLGFSSLILIAVALGVVAIVQMMNVQKGSERLANAYVPEVAVANDIERNLMMAMYAYRAYAFTEQESYNREGQSLLRETLKHIDSARTLGQEQGLEGLLKEEPSIRRGVESYTALSEETALRISEAKTIRAAMDTNAAAFVKALEAVLEEYEADTNAALEERSFKVTQSEFVLNHGSTARILSVRAQATGEAELFDAALDELDVATAAVSAIGRVTRLPADIAMLNQVEGLLKDYGKLIKSFAAETAKGDAAQAQVLDRLREQMDQAAAGFAQQIDVFFTTQMTQLNADVVGGMETLRQANQIIDLGNAARVDNFRAQALRDMSFKDRAVQRIVAMDPLFNELEAKSTEPENRALIADAKRTTSDYSEAMEDYAQVSRVLAELNQKRIDTGTETLEMAKSLASEGIEWTTAISNESVADLGAAERVMGIGLLIAAILGVVLAIMITKSIVRPLTLAIADLSNGSSESSSAAEQVSSASQSLAEGASEQASSLEETSSSMEEITSMVAHNADVAKQTSEHARLASEAASDGVRSMSELRTGADSVNDSAKEMEEAMNAIKESSDSISKIIKTIDEIAFQTNILALNAAVEAARAGEAGAGFAVVADEVRSLAHRAAEAAQETASLIEGSMERSARGVRVNQTVGENLRSVLEKAAVVENGLKSISQTVGEVASSMQGLEASVVEQQEGISQINTAITQVNDVTQTNAASAEEAASAAEEMNAQAVSLMEIVGTLTLMVSGKKPDTVMNPATPGSRASRNEKHFSLPGD